MSADNCARDIVSVRVKPPTAVERLQSTGITVAAAAVVTVASVFVLGIVAFVIALVFKLDLPSLTTTSTGPNDPSSPLGGLTLVDAGGSGASMGGLARGTLVAVAVMVWLATCRIGRGTPGDAVMGILARDTQGHLVGRGRAMARTAIPVLLLTIGISLGLLWVALALLLALWAPALVRRDRRTAFDLAAGVVPQSTEPDRTSTGWTDIPIRR